MIPQFRSVAAALALVFGLWQGGGAQTEVDNNFKFNSDRSTSRSRCYIQPFGFCPRQHVQPKFK